MSSRGGLNYFSGAGLSTIWIWVKITWAKINNFCIKTYNFYTVKEANPDLGKNMLLLKNPQFLPNHCETLSK